MSNKISYSLNHEFVGTLEREFPIEPLLKQYKEALDGSDDDPRGDVDRRIFGEFGRKLADRLFDLESKYRDRSADVIYMVAEKTGHPFPSIQQRLIEIAQLAVMNENKTGFKEISFKRLAYEVRSCMVNQAMERYLGKGIADQVLCQHLCLELYRRICENTGVGNVVGVHMPDKISGENGRCLFSAELILEEKLRLSKI